MHSSGFDRLARALAAPSPRRALFAAVGVALVPVPEAVLAKKRKPKIKRNAFGCVNVGNRCTRAGQCCSTIGAGRRGKKRCRAHDASTCRVGENACGRPLVGCTTSTGNASGVYFTTTGRAPYCGGVDVGKCAACTTDADCGRVCGAGAACVRCSGAGCASSGGFACVATDSCQPPPAAP